MKFNNVEDYEPIKKHLVSSVIQEADDVGVSMYFGTGISSNGYSSLGFGLEYLSFVVASFYLCRKFQLKSVYHEISTVGYNTPAPNDIVEEEFNLAQNVANKIGFKEYSLINSADYHKIREYIDIENDINVKIIL